MNVSTRDRRAVVGFAVFLAVAGLFCMAVGLWPQGDPDAALDDYLVISGAVDLVLAGMAALAVRRRGSIVEPPVAAMPVEA